MLERRPYNHLLALLKRQFIETPQRMTWSIEAVISHFEQYLNPADHELLLAVSAGIADAEQLDKLNVFPAWTDALGDDIRESIKEGEKS